MSESIILLGDNLVVLKDLPDNSIDAIVTDPPYGLSFMGKKWDYDVPSVELWREVLRVLKPGGHVLSFGGTRTYHRMVVAIEDAGFEIRDQVQWLYGSGFPKSMDISKAIDKQAGAEREVLGLNPSSRPNHGQNENLVAINQLKGECVITAPATPAAKQWQGWGTSLKPANEPICLARKPISEKTVAANVLKWGVGGLNIDASRVGVTSDDINIRTNPTKDTGATSMFNLGNGPDGKGPAVQGRWPANLILGCDCEGAEHEQMCAVHLLDEQSGNARSSGQYKPKVHQEREGFISTPADLTQHKMYADSGGASRFFYVAKASKKERNAGLEGMPEKELLDFKGKRLECLNCGKRTMVGSTFACGCKTPNPKWIEETKKHRDGNQNHHPTIKPIKLMEYLIRLITPPGGVVLDPFCGSGSTGVAAKNLGFEFIGIEMNEEYVEIAERRVK